MASWCSAADVIARVKGDPSVALAQEYADQATSILYVLSGRQFRTESTVVVKGFVDRNGRMKLTQWTPVRKVVNVTDTNGLNIPFELSAGGTYITFSSLQANRWIMLTIEVGQNPPVAGQFAAATLAADMMRGDSRYYTSGPNGSRPDDYYPNPRPSSITRQGVTYSYVDLATLSQKNLTGLPEVDLFLQAANPNGKRHQPKVVTAS